MSEQLSASRERKFGVALSYVSMSLTVVVGLVLTPFMLRKLGQAEYGLFQLMGSLIAYLTILDLGFSNATIRYVAKYRAEGNREGEENFLAISCIIYGLIGVLVLIVGAVLYCNISRIFKNSLSLQEIDKAHIMFVIMLFNILITLLSNPMMGAISGQERFIFPRFAGVIKIMARMVLLFILLSVGYKAIGIVVLDTLLNMMLIGISAFYAFSICKISIKFHYFDKALLSEVFSYSFFIFINLIFEQIYWKLDQVILGIMTSTSKVAVYAVGLQICGYYRSLSLGLMSVFLPRAMQMVTRGSSNEELTDLMIRVGRIQLMLIGLVYCGFVLFGREFITLWAGGSYIDAYAIALIVMTPLTIGPLFQNIGLIILQAKNMLAFRAFLYLTASLINVYLTIIFVRHFGYIYAAVATSIGFIIGGVVGINIYYHYKVGLNIPRFFRETLRGTLYCLLACAAAGIGINFIPGHSWRIFSVRVVLLSAVYVILIWKFACNNTEKKLFGGPVIGAYRAVFG